MGEAGRAAVAGAESAAKAEAGESASASAQMLTTRGKRWSGVGIRVGRRKDGSVESVEME